MDARPENDDLSGQTPIYTLAEDAKSSDETYTMSKVEKGRYFYFARNLDVEDINKNLEANEVFVFAL